MLDDATRGLIEASRAVETTPALARRLIPLLDLTFLDRIDSPEPIDALCRDAVTAYGTVAAICVLPGFVHHAKAALGSASVKIATVIEYPEGNGDPEDVMRETEQVLREGAEEIGLVFPYRRFLADTPPPASKNVRAVRDVGGYDIRLKAIMETSVYPSAAMLAAAAEVAIQGGADFLQDVTGTRPPGDRLESASVILSAIKACGLPIGFKTEDVRKPAEAAAILTLADSIMGDGWATPDSFRIGARALLPGLLALI